MVTSHQITLPLYGCVTGILLPVQRFEILPGISLRRGIFDIFSTPMMAFKEAPEGSHTPGPWVPVKGASTSFKSRAELIIEDLAAVDGLTPSQAAWLIASLLRLRIEAPIRISAVANVSLASLMDRNDAWPLSFEAAPHQTGTFRAAQVTLTNDDLDWICEALHIAARLSQEERFTRALMIFDESVWSNRLDIGTVLIWTALEILLDCSGARRKTKAISSALAEHIAHDKADRDRAYNVIHDLYQKRGGVVHRGNRIEASDFAQLHSIARAAFLNVLGRKQLPTRPSKKPQQCV